MAGYQFPGGDGRRGFLTSEGYMTPSKSSKKAQKDAAEFIHGFLMLMDYATTHPSNRHKAASYEQSVERFVEFLRKCPDLRLRQYFSDEWAGIIADWWDDFRADATAIALEKGLLDAGEAL